MKMAPFIKQLPAGLRNLPVKVEVGNFCDIEAIVSPLCFVGQAKQKRSDRGKGIGLRTETDKLRMIPVSAGRSRQDFLRQQRLPPGRNQTSRIQIPGVNRPKSHSSSYIRSAVQSAVFPDLRPNERYEDHDKDRAHSPGNYRKNGRNQIGDKAGFESAQFI